MSKNLAIVCNSLNRDLVAYFMCKLDAVRSIGKESMVLAFGNRAISMNASSGSFVRMSSFTRSSFLDWRLLADPVLAIVNMAIIIFSRVRCIHFTTAHVSNVFMAVPAKLLGMRLIFTIHDIVPHPGLKAGMIELYNRAVLGWLADDVVVFSRVLRSRIPVRLTVHTMELAGFDPGMTSPKSGERTLLFFGRMESYKGLAQLVPIAAMLKKLLPEWKMVVAGKGNIPKRSELEAIGNVRIINRFVEDHELAELFAKASFALLPYDSATQSGVVILSYAYATPVIAYNVGAIAEYVTEETGHLVEQGDIPGIVAYLTGMTEAHIKGCSANVITRFKEHHSRQAAVRAYAGLYREVLDDAS